MPGSNPQGRAVWGWEGGASIAGDQLYRLPRTVPICAPSIIIRGATFHCQKCPDLDRRLHHHPVTSPGFLHPERHSSWSWRFGVSSRWTCTPDFHFLTLLICKIGVSSPVSDFRDLNDLTNVSPTDLAQCLVHSDCSRNRFY